MASNKNILFTIISIALLLIFLETVAFLGCLFLKKKNFYYQPKFDRAYYESYREKMHPQLGWPSPEILEAEEGQYNAYGARKTFAFNYDTLPRPLISAYGDSYIYGHMVHPDSAWTARISEKEGVRVDNYAFPGYGTDQGLLRYFLQQENTAEWVVLGHMSENIRRNINQFRYLLAPGEPDLGLKPRYVLRQDRLEAIPVPDIAVEDFQAFIRNPGEFLEHEYFLPGECAEVIRFRFPYTFTLARTIGHPRFSSKMNKGIFWLKFYEEDHPSGGLELSIAILEEFAGLARQRGQKPLILFNPTDKDLAYFRDKGTWVYQPVIDRIEAAGIPFLNMGEYILQKEENTDICSLYNDCWNHYSPKGNRWVAEAVMDHIKMN